jgi:hypothetical protein
VSIGQQETGTVSAPPVHGDYSVPDKNGNPVRTSDPKKDAYNSDHFSKGLRGDIQGIKHDAQGKSEYRGYLGTPSGKFLIYDPKIGKETELKWPK